MPLGVAAGLAERTRAIGVAFVFGAQSLARSLPAGQAVILCQGHWGHAAMAKPRIA